MSNTTIEFFSALCKTQLNQPLSALDAANNGLGATLAIMYVVSAAVSAYFFAMWKRADSDLKSRVWRRYGWFCALAFFGSVGGLVAAAADIQSRYNFQRFALLVKEQDPCRAFKSDFVAYLDCYAKSAYTTAQMLFWFSVSSVPSVIEFFCVCCVNLLVVERMVDFVAKGQLVGRWFTVSARAAIVSVTVLNATNLAFMAASSYFYFQGSSIMNGLSTKLQNYPDNWDPSEIFTCLLSLESPECSVVSMFNAATDAWTKGMNFEGYGSICQGCSLAIILVSFGVSGVRCIRRFYTGTTISTTAVGRRNGSVRRQIIVTASTVFATFLLRCLYAVALAVSRTGSTVLTRFSPDASCSQQNKGEGVCQSCRELGILVQAWLYLCPAFSFTVLLLSSPVTILVVLWGMTTDNLVQSLVWKCSGCFRKRASLGDGMKSFIGAGGEV